MRIRRNISLNQKELVLKEDKDIRDISDRPVKEGKPGRKQLLLVVEDNVELRKFIHELFENRFRVEEAGDGLADGESLSGKYLI